MILTLAQGSTRIENGVGVVAVTTEYSTSPDDLWEAVTVPERLARWFGEVRARDELNTFDASLSTGWSGIITVDECEQPRIIRLTLIDEAEPATTVAVRLVATEGGTQLTIEERGLPTDDLETYVAGWHAQVDQLVADLSGAPPIEWRPRWEQLRAAYRDTPPGQH